MSALREAPPAPAVLQAEGMLTKESGDQADPRNGNSAIHIAAQAPPPAPPLLVRLYTRARHQALSLPHDDHLMFLTAFRW